MEIQLDEKPICAATLDLEGFKSDMKKYFNLERACENNLVIVEKKRGHNDNNLKSFIYRLMDWSLLLRSFDQIEEDKLLEILLHRALVKDSVKYIPVQADFNKKKFEFEGKVLDEKDDFLLTHNGVFKTEKHIETMLGKDLVDFINYTWKVHINLDDYVDVKEIDKFTNKKK